VTQTVEPELAVAKAKPAIGVVPALTVFLSAFLLFQVQPLIGKYILPWFGGAPGVWTTCLLFFQVALLAGYAYAHLVVSRLSPRTQALLHAALLLGVLLTLPIIPAERLKPPDPANPSGRIILLLALTVGLPYFALATTAPLLQAWVARIDPRVAPYRLYALSNFASLLALVSYPFVIEPLMSRREQAWAWSGLFVLFAVGCAYCAWRAARRKPPPGPPPDEAASEPAEVAPSAYRRFMWVALPACASALLLGTTNTLTQDVAPVPFLWVLPLALYLLTFVLAFDHPRWYSRRVLGPLMVLAAAAMAWAMRQTLHNISIGQMLVVYSGGMFVACLLCHGELARLRPHPRHLTAYYLAISAGGALGGAFVSILAPVLFTRYLEFGLSLWACCALLLVIAATDERSRLRRLRPPLAWVALIGGMATLGYFVWAADVIEPGAVLVRRTRNFYGVLRVHELKTKTDPPHTMRTLHHGRVMHGMQIVDDETLRRAPRAYYGPRSGVGQALQRLEKRPARNIGVIGLGAGTLAALARPGDRLTFYEIDPGVLEVAQSHFDYLRDARATVDVVMGDARLSMERQPPQEFDLLVLDAFSGDAVPVHLLTREAFAIYRRHVRDDGLFAFHISNRHLDLRPVVAGLAQAQGLKVFFISSDPQRGDVAEFPSTWAVMGRSPTPQTPRGDEILWTDDRADLLSILKRHDESE
jgi:hypothetical protein